MKKILLCAAAAMSVCLSASAADTLKVSLFRYAGPYAVVGPHQVDTVDMKGKGFDVKSLLDTPLSFDALKGAAEVPALPYGDDALHLAGFSVQNTSFAKASVDVKGLKDFQVFVDGKKASGELKLEPGTHDVVVKYLGGDEKASVSVVRSKGGELVFRGDGRHIYSLDVNSMGAACAGVDISPNGKFVVLGHRMTMESGKDDIYYELIEAATGKVLYRTRERLSWLPKRDMLWSTRSTVSGRDLIVTDPATGEESVLARGIPSGAFTIAPTEDYLIYSMETEGPKEGEVHQILTPDDRQPGWRDRSYLAKYDIATGLLQPITFGYHNSWLNDISDDGKYLIFSTSRERLTKRPTTLYSFWKMDVATLEAECFVEDDGFVNEALFSPDGSKVVLMGSGEAFGGRFAEVKEGQIPNAYQYLLFLMDLSDRSVKHLTAKFGPAVASMDWNRADGKIYYKTDEKDVQTVYRVDPKSRKIEKLPMSEEYLPVVAVAPYATSLVYYGQSLSNGDRAYLMDTKKLREQKLYDFDAERFGEYDLGEGFGYEFTSTRGDRINCFYVLPSDFDASKKYPMLVHYYGGCSPSARYCFGAYSPQVYAAQGYVFLVVNPSGAAGFGQEFAARHVNTAGDVVADDIIEATQNFCKDHPYVDVSKIGCFSASYGGFMTQLLLTKTDMYRTGISHAGISDHTSYWGEGYWGYSYSEVSMADSYPWTRKDLYVDRSPLYNADKIHTPLLFLHGSVDTNVPIGESIQMFTALKLLGQDTAFVVVDGSNHQVREYGLRRQWLRTIFAWFAKYLKDDPTWWDELYPPKTL